jgi:dienelactone hydrolase
LIILVITLVVFGAAILKKAWQPSAPISEGKPSYGVESAKCGDGFCAQTETKTSCPNDCDELTCRDLYAVTEEICLQKGWKKVKIDVEGLEREMLWKGPQTWKYGAIIAMHGGEGVDSNFCSSVPRRNQPLLSEIFRGVPAEEFGELALKEGFAVFSLNSTYNRVTDAQGRLVGKRWESLVQEGKENIDLPFIEKIIDETIPDLRPQGSSKSIFMTGISNGGFMTILASTHFSDKISAFAPVSAGDPYGTYFDMGYEHLIERKCGPGTWRDNETDKPITEIGACTSSSYLNEIEWPRIKTAITFKQFQSKGDAAVDFSCMQKVQKLLVQQGYKNDGAFILDRGKRALEEHFWQREYNQPLLEFFKRHPIR